MSVGTLYQPITWFPVDDEYLPDPPKDTDPDLDLPYCDFCGLRVLEHQLRQVQRFDGTWEETCIYCIRAETERHWAPLTEAR